AVVAVFAALQHTMLARARQSNRVHRELPITLRTQAGQIFEGIIDLAFVESSRWMIVDFKTDVEKRDRQSRYRRQVGCDMRAMEETTNLAASGYVLHI